MEVFNKKKSCLLKKLEAFGAFLIEEDFHMRQQSVRKTHSIRYIMGKRVEITLNSVLFNNLLKKVLARRRINSSLLTMLKITSGTVRHIKVRFVYGS